MTPQWYICVSKHLYNIMKYNFIGDLWRHDKTCVFVCVNKNKHYSVYSTITVYSVMSPFMSLQIFNVHIRYEEMN